MRVEQPPTGPNSGPTNRLCISLRSPKERRFDPKTWTRWFPRWRKATCGMSWGEIVDDEGNGTRIWPRQKASPMMKVGLGCWRRSGVLQEENVWDLILSALLQWSCRWTWGHFWLNFYILPVWFRNNPCPSSGAIREILGVYLTTVFIHNVCGRYEPQQKTNISQHSSRKIWTGTWFLPECCLEIIVICLPQNLLVTPTDHPCPSGWFW